MKILKTLLLLSFPLYAFSGNGNIDKPADIQQKGIVANKTSVLAKRFSDLTYTPVKGQLFIDGVSANDIKHGYAGNTIVTALLASAAAQDPKLISEMISRNDNGTYTVHFKGLGDITVDGKLPTFKGAPVFTHTPKGELWAAIIEKAYAQVKDIGYEATTDINKRAALQERREVMSDIFGSQLKAHDKTRYDLIRVSKHLSKTLLKSFHRRLPSVAIAGGDLHSKIGSDKVYDYGLAPGHAYAVLDVKKQKNGQIKVRLYNPWGRIEPGIGVGAINSVEAGKKKDSAKKAMATDGRHDGAFWLSWHEFYKYFDWVTGPIYEAPKSADSGNKPPVLDNKNDTQASSPLSLKLTPTAIKHFAFTWKDAQDETHYKLFEKPNKDSKFTEIAKLAANRTSYSHSVPLHKRVNAEYILEACNDAGCTSSVAVSVADTWVDAIGYFKPSNTDSNDALGKSVALSADGQTLAVGAPREDSNATGVGGHQADNSAEDSGAVYVFSRRHGHWVQQANIKASNTDPGDVFGVSLSLSADGNTLAVGATGERSEARGIEGDQEDNTLERAGAVYMFARNGKHWTQQAYIKASNTNKKDIFGVRVVLSGNGDTLAVGAVGESSKTKGIDGDQNDHSARDSGAVYVYSRLDDSWSQQAYVKASNTDIRDHFGFSIALSADGRTLAVGAMFEASRTKGINGDASDNSAHHSGAVYVYTRHDDNWSQQAYVKASNTDSWDRFGTAVSLSADGHTLAVGAAGEGSNATGIDDDQADNSRFGAGAAYVYTRRDGVWSQEAYVKAPDTKTKGGFGYAVTLSSDGKTLAALSSLGGPTGTILVYTHTDDLWLAQAPIKLSNKAASGIALSDDGNTLALGIYKNNSDVMRAGVSKQDSSAFESKPVCLY